MTTAAVRLHQLLHNPTPENWALARDRPLAPSFTLWMAVASEFFSLDAIKLAWAAS